MEPALLIFIIVIIIILFFRDSPTKAGKRGEQIVEKIILKNLDKEIYKLINDITIPSKSGSTQIDHIIISIYGIFVIETKNWQGWIFGGENQKTWTQINYQYKNKYMNPLRQNYGHIKALQSILNLPMNCFYSVIVFAENGTFKTNMPNNVIYENELSLYIKSKIDPKFREENVDEIINKIESARLELK